MTGGARRWWLTLAAAVAAIVIVAGVAGGPAAAAPGRSADSGDEGYDEAATRELRTAMEAANRGYLEAQAALEASKRRQQELTEQLKAAEVRVAVLTAEVTRIAVTAYRVPRVSTTVALLGSDAQVTLLDRMTTIDVLAAQQSQKIHELRVVRNVLAHAKAEIDVEVANQKKFVAVAAKKKQEAERAFREATEGFGSGPTAVAAPAPRAANGSLPPQACTAKDPTTSGCLTQRTLHALQQAKRAGFTATVSCYRSLQDGGEHPKGRACDFAAGSGGDATGPGKVYGDNLAMFFVRNASRLGVLYVIWYRQIWMPATGWRAYKGKGDPSSDHTNHVHLSMY